MLYTEVLLAPLFELNDEYNIDTGDIYQFACASSSWQRMTDELEQVAAGGARKGYKIVTANAERKRYADTIRYRISSLTLEGLVFQKQFKG